jgi:hypothetical protein
MKKNWKKSTTLTQKTVKESEEVEKLVVLVGTR